MLLQRDIHLAVGTDGADIAPQTVAAMQLAEYLTVVDKSLILVVDNDLEAEVCLLPHEYVNLIACLIRRTLLREIVLYLCRGHDAVCLLVKMYVHHVRAPFLHPALLLTEGAEDILHEPPVKECPELIHPCHREEGEIADHGQRTLCGSHGALVLVEIYEDVYLVAYACPLGDITVRQEDIARRASVKI